MIDGHGKQAEATQAERFRQESATFADEAREARQRGDDTAARAAEQTAADYRLQASDLERSVRGLPPLPASWGPEGIS